MIRWANVLFVAVIVLTMMWVWFRPVDSPLVGAPAQQPALDAALTSGSVAAALRKFGAADPDIVLDENASQSLRGAFSSLSEFELVEQLDADAAQLTALPPAAAMPDTESELVALDKALQSRQEAATAVHVRRNAAINRLTDSQLGNRNTAELNKARGLSARLQSLRSDVAARLNIVRTNKRLIAETLVAIKKGEYAAARKKLEGCREPLPPEHAALSLRCDYLIRTQSLTNALNTERQVNWASPDLDKWNGLLDDHAALLAEFPEPPSRDDAKIAADCKEAAGKLSRVVQYYGLIDSKSMSDITEWLPKVQALLDRTRDHELLMPRLRTELKRRIQAALTPVTVQDVDVQAFERHRAAVLQNSGQKQLWVEFAKVCKACESDYANDEMANPFTPRHRFAADLLGEAYWPTFAKVMKPSP